jgi:hypothetical protein
VFVAAVTASGGTLRLVVLHDSLFADELSTYWIISDRGLGDVISTVHSDAEITPPLYFVLAWLTTRLDFTAELVRAPSFLAGVAAIPLVYVLGLRTVGRSAALVATVITALSPFMIYYSTEARGYQLMVVLVVLSTLALLAAVDDRRARWWVAYAAASCAAVYTHYTAIFALGAQLLWALWAHPEARRAVLLANLGAAVAFLPWISGLVADLNSPTTRILGELQPFTLDRLRTSLERWSVGYPPFSVTLRSLPGYAGLVLIALGVGMATVGAFLKSRRVVIERHSKGSYGEVSPRFSAAGLDRGLALVIALVLAAPVGIALVSAIGTDTLAGRNLAVSWPAFALVLAKLLVSAPQPMRIAAVGLVFAGFGIGAVKTLDSKYQRPDYEAAARFVDRDSSPRDVIVDASVLSPGPLSGLDVALGEPRRVLRAGAPQEREHPFGLFDPVLPLDDVVRNARIAARDGRIIVVSLRSDLPVAALPLTYSQLQRAVAERLPRSYRLRATRVYPGFLPAAVQVYEQGRRSGNAQPPGSAGPP